MTRTRRAFIHQLCSSLAVPSLLAASGIGKEKSHAAEAPGPRADASALEKGLRALQAKTGLKIKSIETFTQGSELCVVRVRTDDGAEGYGQAAPSDGDITATVMHRKIAPHVLGADPADFEAISDRVIEANYKFPWSFVCRGLGGVDNDLAQWRRMFRTKAVDIAQPDVCYVGGFTRALRVAELARQFGVPCVPHSSNLSMVIVFTLHLFGAIPNAGRHVEFTIEPNSWKDLYRPALEVRDGRVAIPDGPGWGVTINPAWLAKAQHQESRLR